MSIQELNSRCRHAAYRGYMDALDFIIARKENPKLMNPPNPYDFSRQDECLTWRTEFDETMLKKGKE